MCHSSPFQRRVEASINTNGICCSYSNGNYTFSTHYFDATISIKPRDAESDNVMMYITFKFANKELQKQSNYYKYLARVFSPNGYAQQDNFSYFNIAEHDSESSTKVLEDIQAFVDILSNIDTTFSNIAKTRLLLNKILDIAQVPYHVMENYMKNITRINHVNPKKLVYLSAI